VKPKEDFEKHSREGAPIVYIETNSNYPVVNQRNQKIHVPRSVAEVAVGFGQASYCPRPNYGTKEWQQERQQLDAQRPPDSGAAPYVDGVQWSVKDKMRSEFKVTTIIKSLGTEKQFFTAPTAEMPAHVVAAFNVAEGVEPGAAYAAHEKAKREQYEYNVKHNIRNR